jgi:hypothetical protein
MAIEWRLLDQDTARLSWNHALESFSDATPYQRFEWGEYRSKVDGVRPCRWAAFDDQGDIAALFQGALAKNPFGVAMVTGLGGPVGNLEAAFPTLKESILVSLGVRRGYCWISPARRYSAADALLLKSAGWQRSLFMPESGWTMWLDLRRDEDEILQCASRNWRRSLRRAIEHGGSAQRWATPDVGEIKAVYRSMEALKGLPVQFAERNIAALLETFGSALVLYRSRNAQGETIALRGCVITGRNALDLFAATTDQGRQRQAAFPVFWEMLRECRTRGVERLDLGGIDPVNNPGVFRFKKDTGAALVEYLGDWDWATSEGLRVVANLVRARKGKTARIER